MGFDRNFRPQRTSFPRAVVSPTGNSIKDSCLPAPAALGCAPLGTELAVSLPMLRSRFILPWAFLGLFFCLFVPAIGSASSQCSSLFEPANSYEQKLEALRLSTYQQFTGRKGSKRPPKDWRNSRRKQAKQAKQIYQTSPAILAEISDIKKELRRGTQSAEDITSMQLLTRVKHRIESTYFRDRLTLIFAKGPFKKLSQSTNQLLESSGAQDIPFWRMSRFINRFYQTVEEYKLSYGPEFFEQQRMKKAAFDVFAIHMLSEILKTPIPSVKAVYALALLHPITDEALDSGLDVSDAMKKITKKLNGLPVQAETRYEVVALGLVDDILRAHPEDANPWVIHSLRRLHTAQLKSVVIQKSGTVEEVIDNTLDKGALTYLLFGALAVGDLTAGQAEYFYRAGAILQLVDDLLDLGADFEEGQKTPWTIAYSDHRKSLKSPYQRTILLLNLLNKDAPELLGDWPSKDKLVGSFNFAFRLFTLASMTDPFAGKYIAKQARELAPVPPKVINNVVTGLLDTLEAGAPGPEKPLVEVLDMGFLNGRYFGNEDGNDYPVAPDRLDTLPSRMNVGAHLLRHAHQWLRDDLERPGKPGLMGVTYGYMMLYAAVMYANTFMHEPSPGLEYLFMGQMIMVAMFLCGAPFGAFLFSVATLVASFFI